MQATSGSCQEHMPLVLSIKSHPIWLYAHTRCSSLSLFSAFSAFSPRPPRRWRSAHNPPESMSRTSNRLYRGRRLRQTAYLLRTSRRLRELVSKSIESEGRDGLTNRRSVHQSVLLVAVHGSIQRALRERKLPLCSPELVQRCDLIAAWCIELTSFVLGDISVVLRRCSAS